MFPVKDGAVRWLFGVVNRATQISVSSWMARDLPTSGSHAQIGATEKGKSRLVKYYLIWPDVYTTICCITHRIHVWSVYFLTFGIHLANKPVPWIRNGL